MDLYCMSTIGHCCDDTPDELLDCIDESLDVVWNSELAMLQVVSLVS